MSEGTGNLTCCHFFVPRQLPQRLGLAPSELLDRLSSFVGLWKWNKTREEGAKAKRARKKGRDSGELEKSGITLPGELVKAYVSFIFDLRIRDKKLVLAQRSSNSLTSQPPKFSLDLGPFSGLWKSLCSGSRQYCSCNKRERKKSRIKLEKSKISVANGEMRRTIEDVRSMFTFDSVVKEP